MNQTSRNSYSIDSDDDYVIENPQPTIKNKTLELYQNQEDFDEEEWSKNIIKRINEDNPDDQVVTNEQLDCIGTNRQVFNSLINAKLNVNKGKKNRVKKYQQDQQIAEKISKDKYLFDKTNVDDVDDVDKEILEYIMKQSKEEEENKKVDEEQLKIRMNYIASLEEHKKKGLRNQFIDEELENIWSQVDCDFEKVANSDIEFSDLHKELDWEDIYCLDSDNSESKISDDSDSKISDDSDSKISNDSDSKISNDSESKLSDDSDSKISDEIKTASRLEYLMHNIDNMTEEELYEFWKKGEEEFNF